MENALDGGADQRPPKGKNGVKRPILNYSQYQASRTPA